MKKRGIIVATIVMVLVLAVSLTTATYAWFSDDAKATVDNLTIATTASTGVQIAVYQDTNYYNGTIVYDEANSKWDMGTGTMGFGTLLDFSDVEMGNMKNAVTNRAFAGTKNAEALFWYQAEGTQPATYDKAVIDTLYYVDANGKVTAGTTITADTFATYTGGYYASRTAITASDDCDANGMGGTFFRPLGYNSDLTPTGYEKVAANTSVSTGEGDNKAVSKTSYYDIPLAMQSVQNTKAILCTLKITPDQTKNLKPGMAAATYIRITPIGADGNPIKYATGDKAGQDQQYLFKPFDKYVYNNGTMTQSSKAEDANKNADGVLNFVVSSGEILTSDVYKLRIEIWVEGTDNECNNVLMQATSFDVDFAFDVYNDDLPEGFGTTITELTKGEGAEAIKYLVYDGLSQLGITH